MTSFECTNSVFNVIGENNSFSITAPGHWNSESAKKTVDELKKLMKLRSQNDIDSHVKQVRKKGLVSKNDYSLSSLDSFKEGLLEELKNSKYNHLEDMVYRFQLTYDEIIDILYLKDITGSTKGYTLAPGVYEISDNNFMLKSQLPEEVKVNITIDDVRLKSNLTTIKAIRFTKKFFFHTILCFIESHSGELGDIEGFIQLIPGTNKSDKAHNITGIDKIHLKCDCVNESIVNGIRESISDFFALDQPPGRKTYKERRIKLFKKINKTVLSHITYVSEDDDLKPVDFHNKTISFTCQISKI